MKYTYSLFSIATYLEFDLLMTFACYSVVLLCCVSLLHQRFYCLRLCLEYTESLLFPRTRDVSLTPGRYVRYDPLTYLAFSF
jgi:hypothetical protein